MNQRIQKQNIREKYWRYSLYVILLGLGTVIFVELIPFLGGLLGALTIYVLLRGQMRALTIRHKLRRSLAASLLIGEAIVCFLIPLSLLVWLLVAKLQDVTLDPSTVIQPIRNLAELIRERIGYNLLDGDNIAKLVELLPRAGQWVLQSIGSFAVNVVVLLFVLYFMLIGGREMESYLRKFIPFNRTVTQEFTREVVMIVRSNAIGIPLLAVIQGAVALVGYWLCGVPWALFWGVVTCVATIVPLLGTALVWLPLAAYLGLIGHWGAAVGLLAYGVVVITQVDNLARFVLQKRMADTHPLVTIFGVIIGLSLFGFMGVIFGPVLLSIFIFCADLFKRRYLDEAPMNEVLPRLRNVRRNPAGNEFPAVLSLYVQKSQRHRSRRRLFRGLQSFANPNCRLELRTGEMPAYCLPVTAKAGPRLSARSFSGNDRILGLLRFLLKDGEGIIV